MFKLAIILFSCVLTTKCSFLDYELSQLSSIPNLNSMKPVKNYDSIENKIVSIGDAIDSSRELVKRWMTQTGTPGVVIGLTIKSKNMWIEGFGHTDIENNVTTHGDSVWRLASISKSITSALVGKLIEEKKLDLDKPINSYLSPKLYPIKEWENKKVDITVRQLMSHTSGLPVTRIPEDIAFIYKADKVTQTLEIRKNEKLLFKPGSGFAYSNYGIQVVGAVIEAIVGDTFENAIKAMFAKLGMYATLPEKRETVMPNTPRYYQLDSVNSNSLINCDIFDELFSYEGWWPSGGIVSTTKDLLRFGNAMLQSFHGKKNSYLKSSTVNELWRNETFVIFKEKNGNHYAKGWFTTDIPDTVDYPYKKIIWHSGGMFGTLTLLFIFPEQHIVITSFANQGGVANMDQILLLIANNFKSFI